MPYGQLLWSPSNELNPCWNKIRLKISSRIVRDFQTLLPAPIAQPIIYAPKSNRFQDPWNLKENASRKSSLNPNLIYSRHDRIGFKHTSASGAISLKTNHVFNHHDQFSYLPKSWIGDKSLQTLREEPIFHVIVRAKFFKNLIWHSC